VNTGKLLLAAAAAVVLVAIGIAVSGTLRSRPVAAPNVTASPQTSRRQASTVCISASEPIPNWTDAPPADCSVSWEQLGADGNRLLYAGRYSWPSDSETAAQHNYKVVTAVLYEGRGTDDSVVPLWNLRVDETDESLRSVSLVRVGPIPLVRVETCLNGTGGCAATLYRWRPGALVDLTSDLRQQIAAALPAGYSLYKVPDIDVKSMTISGGAWAKDDPACCPTSTLTCTLKLGDGKASAIDCRVTRTADQR
jgi:hypothetical protein